MRYYDAADVIFTINEERIPCVVSIDYGEVMELSGMITASQGWLEYATNLQGYQLDISGEDSPGYLFLRDLKRSRAEVEWEFSTIDNFLRLSGTALITQVGTSYGTDRVKNWSATLQGIGQVIEPIVEAARLLEDDDFRLLEDGDLRVLQNATT